MKNNYWNILKDFDPDTNARAIIKHWIDKYKSTKNPYFARCIFEATNGEVYPDDLKSFGYDVDRNWHSKELDFINEPNMIY